MTRGHLAMSGDGAGGCKWRGAGAREAAKLGRHRTASPQRMIQPQGSRMPRLSNPDLHVADTRFTEFLKALSRAF